MLRCVSDGFHGFDLAPAGQRYCFFMPVVQAFPAIAADYARVIARPMDLGSVGRMLRSHRRPSLAAFVENVLRVFANAVEYNHGRETFENQMPFEVVQAALHLGQWFQWLLLESSLISEDPALPPTSPTAAVAAAAGTTTTTADATAVAGLNTTSSSSSSSSSSAVVAASEEGMVKEVGGNKDGEAGRRKRLKPSPEDADAAASASGAGAAGAAGTSSSSSSSSGCGGSSGAVVVKVQTAISVVHGVVPSWHSITLSSAERDRQRQRRERLVLEAPLGETLKDCEKLLKDLNRTNDKKQSWIFEEPVDRVANVSWFN